MVYKNVLFYFILLQFLSFASRSIQPPAVRIHVDLTFKGFNIYKY